MVMGLCTHINSSIFLIDRVINKVVNWVINMTANCILVVNKPIMVVNITTMGVNKVVTFF